MTMKRLTVALLAAFSISNAFAQHTGNTGGTQNQGDPAQPVCSRQDELATVPPPSVIKKLKDGEAPYPYPYSLQLGKFVTVNVPHDKYVEFFTKRDNNVQPTPVLYINEFAIKGLTVIATGCENFSFMLTRTADSRDVWGSELAKLDGMDNVPVGIGTVQSGYVTDVGSAKLVLSGGISTAYWWLVMAFLIGSLIWMGASSGLLRDLPARPAAGADDAPIPAHLRPFSLARMQMAFWFVLAVGGYVYIWIKTGDIVGVIPDSIITLMGISAGTTVLSAVIDASGPARQPVPASGNFFKDILMDSDGISFHRFQMLVWTLVLGVVFVEQVWATLIMPKFDPQLLGLMGVGSATYLGFKLPAAAAASGAMAADTPAASNQQPPAAG